MAPVVFHILRTVVVKRNNTHLFLALLSDVHCVVS